MGWNKLFYRKYVLPCLIIKPTSVNVYAFEVGRSIGLELGWIINNGNYFHLICNVFPTWSPISSHQKIAWSSQLWFGVVLCMPNILYSLIGSWKPTCGIFYFFPNILIPSILIYVFHYLFTSFIEIVFWICGWMLCV